MKLSDAIATGSLLMEQTNPHTFCGCALAMGLKAVGKEPCRQNLRTAMFDTEAGMDSMEWRMAAEREWPWLKNFYSVPGNDWAESKAEGTVIISELFFDVWRGDLTLKQLIDWVKSVEPTEVPMSLQGGNQCELVRSCKE